MENPTEDFKILVVDDDQTILAVAQRQLKRLGYSCQTAMNGAQAVLKVTSNHFDLIFMDVQMPEMDGLEAAKLIRKKELESNETTIPIIAITANPDREGCLSAGMNDYIFKPVMLKDMHDALERWLPGIE